MRRMSENGLRKCSVHVNLARVDLLKAPHCHYSVWHLLCIVMLLFAFVFQESRKWVNTSFFTASHIDLTVLRYTHPTSYPNAVRMSYRMSLDCLNLPNFPLVTSAIQCVPPPHQIPVSILLPLNPLFLFFSFPLLPPLLLFFSPLLFCRPWWRGSTHSPALRRRLQLPEHLSSPREAWSRVRQKSQGKSKTRRSHSEVCTCMWSLSLQFHWLLFLYLHLGCVNVSVK